MKVRLHFDYWLMTGISGVFTLVYLGCLLWAGLLVLMQVFGWLRFGEWQHVALYSLFLTSDSQSFIRQFEGDAQPLNAVPALGFGESLDALAWKLAGRMVGVAKVMTWLLDTALILWVLAGAFVSLALATGAKSESTALLPAKQAP